MKRTIVYLLALALAGFWVSILAAEEPLMAEIQAPKPSSSGVEMEMLIIEGMRDLSSPPVKIVTSSFLKFLTFMRIRPEEGLGTEQQIKQVYNLKNAKLINTANLRWEKGKSEKAFHIFRLDSKEYLILVTPGRLPEPQQFHIEVYEQGEKDKSNLLDMEFNIPEKNAAVFGFEDTGGNPYFLSLRVLRYAPAAGGGIVGGVRGGVEGGVLGGVEGGVEGGVGSDVALAKAKVRQEIAEFEKDAVKASGEIKSPKRLKSVDPVYPEKARKAQVEGTVILEAKADEKGDVEDVKILRSIPVLDQAAIDAVKQWKYEPLVIDGKPRKVVFTVTVRFMLKSGDKTKDLEKFAQGAVKAEGDIAPPKLIKLVDPVYPEDARKAGVEGVVILSAKTDASGKVQDVMILRSIPLLNQAAIDAVKQWVYEPLLINNVPTSVVFTVTVSFQLKDP